MQDLETSDAGGENAGAGDAPEGPHARSLPGYLTERYRGWRASRFEENRAWYARLAADGQHPRSMVIQCCDSRFNVAEIFGAEPGDLFIVRNIASLVPPYGPDHNHHGTSAAVEFAVNALKVAHIVVVGHSNCGGTGACHAMCAGKAPELEQSTSFIGRWMDILRPGYDRVAARVSGEAAQKTALEREAVLVSLENLETFPFVAQAREAGMLTLHGAWFDIGNGRLHVYSPDSGFTPV
ncbi:MAG TPA: carbonic anhydrase [Paracoccaceae bacterium]|nr:carbonic anhydrase [Paracoccaceae bacterium]